ncbi:hypothetical protein KA005_02065, partial [bacterium]|nr:hypothetical protein [bacterium]
MPENNKIIIIAPMADGQISERNVYPWASCRLVEFGSELTNKGEDVTLIYGSEATPVISRAIVLERNPNRIYSFGHGWPKGHTVEKSEPFLTTGGLNLDLVENRTVHLLSCLCAQGPGSLGQKIQEEGAKVFFGYSDTFILTVWKEPCSCRFLTGCFEGDLEIERALTDSENNNYNAVYNQAIAKFNNEIAYWEEHYNDEMCNSSGVSAEMAEMLIDCLVHDRDALVAFYPLPVRVGGVVRANVVITNTFSHPVKKDLFVRFGVYNKITGEFVSQ